MSEERTPDYQCSNDCPGHVSKYMSCDVQEKQHVKYEPMVRCNFCGKGAEQVFLMIQGPSVNICSECTMEGMELVTKEIVRRETKLEKVVSFAKPEDNILLEDKE